MSFTTEQLEALRLASIRLLEIVEGTRSMYWTAPFRSGDCKSGRFGSFRPIRLKDTKEWVEFYLAMSSLRDSQGNKISRNPLDKPDAAETHSS